VFHRPEETRRGMLSFCSCSAQCLLGGLNRSQHRTMLTILPPPVRDRVSPAKRPSAVSQLLTEALARCVTNDPAPRCTDEGTGSRGRQCEGQGGRGWGAAVSRGRGGVGTLNRGQLLAAKFAFAGGSAENASLTDTSGANCGRVRSFLVIL